MTHKYPVSNKRRDIYDLSTGYIGDIYGISLY